MNKVPYRIIMDPAEVVVQVARELKRFHVAVRMGSQGMSLKVTDGGTRRLRKEVAKAAEKYGDAWYQFDYTSYENAVIFVPDKTTPLPEYIQQLQEVPHGQ